VYCNIRGEVIAVVKAHVVVCQVVTQYAMLDGTSSSIQDRHIDFRGDGLTRLECLSFCF
jgi:hypothetical protein